MKKNLSKRLRSQAGETIAEVLVATLIVVLSTVLLVGMVNASKNAVMSGRKVMNKYYDSSQAGGSDGEVTISWGGASSETVAVHYTSRELVGGSKVVSYAK